jgi:molecular chaperone GrpE
MMDWQNPEPLLDQFRKWLGEARREAKESSSDHNAAPVPPNATSPASAAMVDVVAVLTALRQELKLETKSTRGLQEQVERLVVEMGQALCRFDSLKPDEEKAALAVGEPLAHSLAELDEALERGRLAVQQARKLALEELQTRGPAELDMRYYSQWFWSRWKSRQFFHTIRKEWLRQLTESQHAIWEGLEQGYQLVQNRLKRSMDSQGIKRLATVGHPVDPHSMIVVEVVLAPERTPGQVAEEVRPGYTWKGKVLRLAEVRAVQNDPATPLASGEPF